MNDAKPLSLTPYLDIIYRHRLSAGCVLGLGLGTTLCLMLMLPDVYRSTAVLAIEPPQVSSAYVDVGDATERRQNLNVSDQLEALAHQAFSQRRLEELIRTFGLYGKRPGQSLEAAVRYMGRHIDLVVPQDAILYESARTAQQAPDVLKISFEYGDRKTVQRVTEQLANNYIDEGYRERIERAENATRFLTTQVVRASAELAAKGRQLQELERRYEGSLPEELEPNLTELGRLQNQLSLINQQLTTARLNPLAVGQPVALTPEQELTALELKLAALRAEYSDEYPDVIQLKERIANLRQQLRRARGSSSGSSSASDRGDYPGSAQAALERQAAMLASQIAALNARIAATPVHGQELDAIRRDYDALDTEYHNLLKKQLGAQLHLTLEQRHEDGRLRLLENADLPRGPLRPDRAAIGILGVVFSLGAALAFPFALYFTDTSFKEPAELQGEYGLSVVAMIPELELPAERHSALLRAALASSGAMLVIAVAIWAYTNLLF